MNPYRKAKYTVDDGTQISHWVSYLRELKKKQPLAYFLLRKSRSIFLPGNHHLEEALDYLEITSSKYWKAAQNSSKTLDNYIAVPSNIPDFPLYVAKRREYPDLDWEEAHITLQKKNQFMLTIRQFVDFVSYLNSGEVYDGTGAKVSESEIGDILDDILGERGPWRGEWLDAAFGTQSESVFMFAPNTVVDGQIKKQNKHKLEERFLDRYYANLFGKGKTDERGLPVGWRGNIRYIGPEYGGFFVARFEAGPYVGSYVSRLNCIADYAMRYQEIGVRPAMVLPHLI